VYDQPFSRRGQGGKRVGLFHYMKTLISGFSHRVC
jgi:hypothetical protein